MIEAIFLLALNIYHEADYKDDFVCRIQIAQVVIQRSVQTKTSIKRVIFKPKQFSWTEVALNEFGELKTTHIPNFNSKRWKDSMEAANMVYYGKALNYMPGTDHFYADYIKPPYWWKAIKPESIFKCGKHWFGTIDKHYKIKGKKMFKPWPKIPRFENEIYHITEKIDGTNACVIIQPYLYEHEKDCIWTDYQHSIFAQSRSKLIKPSDDNYNFAKWVQANAEQLITDLGEGYHFGEWWGQGIQRNYGLTEKRFSLFNPTKRSSICHNVPLVKFLTQDEFENTTWKEQYIREMEEFGSLAAPGFMKPEGLVVYAEKAKSYWKVIIDK